MQFNVLLVKAWNRIVVRKKLICEASNKINLSYPTQNIFLAQFQNCLIHALGSPIGIELFNDFSLLNDCIDYLLKYLVKQQNISFTRPHTFGYLFSQLAVNKSSLLGLRNSGIINLMIEQAWKSIEYFDCTGHAELTGNYSLPRISNPPIWSIDPIDKIAYKPFINLVRVTTSYESIRNLMNGTQLLTNKENYNTSTDKPTNLPEFIDRVVFVNSAPKLQSLFNPEQCQLFGLRLLSCIISCLDSLLWFETYLNLSEYLLGFQNENRILDSNLNVIYDLLTIECNYLLVKIFFIGGPSERRLPPRVLCQHTNKMYPYTILRSKPDCNDDFFNGTYYYPFERATEMNDKSCQRYPCVHWYNQLPSSSIRSICLTDLLPLDIINYSVASIEEAEKWIDQCRTVFMNSKTISVCRNELGIKEKCKCVGDFLNQCLLAMSYLQESNTKLQPLPEVNKDAIKKFTLSKMDEIAIDWTIRYGQRLGLLLYSSSSSEEKRFRKDQLSNKSKLVDEPFDWFAATIFLVYNADYQSAWDFLSKFAAFPHSVYLWPTRRRHLTGFRDSFYLKSCQYFEHLLAIECSNVFNTFVMSEISPVQIYSRWINQCYWNYFDWLNIMNYLLLCLLNPIQFQIYTNVCIMKHLGPVFLQTTNEQPTSQEQQPEQLIVFLQEEPIRGFDCAKYLSYMYELDQKYTKLLSMDLIKTDDSLAEISSLSFLQVKEEGEKNAGKKTIN
ncbi:unnamed protein product [Heterobilharzia americana]|nr:unnamed protein product [Heterobilharzia americana]